MQAVCGLLSKGHVIMISSKNLNGLILLMFSEVCSNNVPVSPDVDECVLGLDDCADETNCTNTFGSFDCGCPRGFQGDGVNCTGLSTIT